MEAIVLDNLGFNVDIEALSQEMRVANNPRMMEQLTKLVEEAKNYAQPKAIYRAISVEDKGEDFVVINGVKLSSRVVRANLGNGATVYAAVVTCGTEAAAWAEAKTDILEQYWANCICEAVLHGAIIGFERYLAENYQLGTLSMMNPGSVPDWLLREQPLLFSIIGDVTGQIGVALSDSFLMSPIKSVSGIWFPGDDYKNCMLCKKDCPNRKATYNETKVDEYGL